MKKKVDDPHKLTVEEALSLLEPHKEGRKLRVHSFTDSGFALMGCNIDLTTIKKRLKETEDIRLSGRNMKALGHGFAYFDKKYGYIFLETNMNKVKDIKTQRDLKD